MKKYKNFKRQSVIWSSITILLLVISIVLFIIHRVHSNEIISYLAYGFFISGMLSAANAERFSGYVIGFKHGRGTPADELADSNWEEVDALLLNHHEFYADDIAWGSYGWPAPAGDKFDIYVWERRSDGARYITVEIKNYIWFICYQTLHMIYLVPAGDSEIPHDTSLNNKDFLGIINEISKNSCSRLFTRNGNMTLYVNGRWYEDWERFEYRQ